MKVAVLQGLSVPACALVTGASSGIGLAAVAELLDDPSVATVFAVSRGAQVSAALGELEARHGDRLVPIAADITLEIDLAALAARVAERAPALHLVFNAAGLLHAPDIRPEKAVAALRMDTLMRVFAINAFAPVLLAKALLPRLKHSQPSVVASLSARVGSIGDNRLGGWYAYRASKAAQNQLLRTLSVELRRSHPRTCCVALHPGTVDTPLSSPFHANVPPDALFTPRRAARQLLDVIAGLTPAESGGFFAWDGSPIPW